MGAPVGERNGQAKLTAADVECARLRYASGRTTVGRLARLFGVSRGAMGDALSGRTWGHVWRPVPSGSGTPLPSAPR